MEQTEFTKFTKSLMDEYVHATDCNLATLEHYCLVKKFSSGDIQRQMIICERMLVVCDGFPDEYSIHSRHAAVRVAALILEARKGTNRNSLGHCIAEVVCKKVQELKAHRA